MYICGTYVHMGKVSSVNLPIIAAFWSILDVVPAPSLIDTKLHSNTVNESLNYICIPAMTALFH